MYKIETTNKFKHSYQLAQRRGLPIEMLNTIIQRLANGEKLEAACKDHSLRGKFAGLRECHIMPNWLLIYKRDEVLTILYLVDTGTHSDLF